MLVVNRHSFEGHLRNYLPKQSFPGVKLLVLEAIDDVIFVDHPGQSASATVHSYQQLLLLDVLSNRENKKGRERAARASSASEALAKKGGDRNKNDTHTRDVRIERTRWYTPDENLSRLVFPQEMV